MDYGDSIIRLHLNNGVMTVADDFTPLNQATLNSEDRDVASGGVLVLPDQTSGGHTHLLVQLGKEGRISVVDRDSMGGYSTSTDNIVEEIPVNNSGQTNQNFEVGGLWGMPAFGNNTVYIWGTSDNLKSFPLSSGKISTTPSNTGAQEAGSPSPTPVISSNGTSSPIVWSVQSDEMCIRDSVGVQRRVNIGYVDRQKGVVFANGRAEEQRLLLVQAQRETREVAALDVEESKLRES